MIQLVYPQGRPLQWLIICQVLGGAWLRAHNLFPAVVENWLHPQGIHFGKLVWTHPHYSKQDPLSDCEEERTESESKTTCPHQHPTMAWAGVWVKLETRAERVAWKTLRFGKCLSMWSLYYSGTKWASWPFVEKEKKIVIFSSFGNTARKFSVPISGWLLILSQPSLWLKMFCFVFLTSNKW